MCINIDTALIQTYVDSLVEKNVTDSILRARITDAISDSMDSLLNKALVDTSLVEKISNSHWYNYYNSAFQELIATHVGLFGALIAVTAVIFGFKYWNDNVNLKRIVKDAAQNSAIKATKDEIPKVTKNVVDETITCSITGTIDALLTLADRETFDGEFFCSLLKMMQVFSSRLQGRFAVSLLFSFRRLIEKIEGYEQHPVNDDLKNLIIDVKNSLNTILRSYLAKIVDDDVNMYEQLNKEWNEILYKIKGLIGV